MYWKKSVRQVLRFIKSTGSKIVQDQNGLKPKVRAKIIFKPKLYESNIQH